MLDQWGLFWLIAITEHCLHEERSFRFHLSEGDLRCPMAVIFNTNSVCKFSWCVPLDSPVYIRTGRVADKGYRD